MCPTFPLVPGSTGPLFVGEAEAELTEAERHYLDGLSEAGEFEDPAFLESPTPDGELLAEDYADGPSGEEPLLEQQLRSGELLDDELLGDPFASELLVEMPGLAEDEDEVDDIAERVAARLAARTARRTQGVTELEEEQQRPRPRWTTCLTAEAANATVRVYEENVTAAASDPPGVRQDRCSCIVMLNVGLAALLGLSTKNHPARTYKPSKGMTARPRTVRMAALTTETIELAMAQLVRAGHATGPVRVDFRDSRGRRAGTLAPVSMHGSVLRQVLDRVTQPGCWYAFAMSLMDGFHSVLLLVDNTGASPRVFWLDQNRNGLDLEVTSTLDTVITDFTTSSWQQVLTEKNKRFSTPVRLWPLRVRA